MFSLIHLRFILETALDFISRRTASLDLHIANDFRFSL